MLPKILLVNPPVYDFTAYDFWLKPYGMLTVGGFFRQKADMMLFDFLNRRHPFFKTLKKLESDQWGQGRFYCSKIPLPTCLKHIPRYFRRFGLPSSFFRDFLQQTPPCEFVFVQTTMTYWYPGVSEVIEDVRHFWPESKIVLGGNYATLCPAHAAKLGADLILPAKKLDDLWQKTATIPDFSQPALWEVYEEPGVGTLKISDGCPFNCTYCSVPQVYHGFKPRSRERSLRELELLLSLDVKNIAFYDDALLFQSDNVLAPFLQEVINRGYECSFHTPNGLNARFLTRPLAELMVTAGFKTFYLGFESVSPDWQENTGGKVSSKELEEAVDALRRAGVPRTNITAYQILGHPATNCQQLEATMRFINGLGIKGMLADFSPIPGTPDGLRCTEYVDMNEPLMHNKTAFAIIILGFDETNRLKDLQRKLNRAL